MKRASGSTGRGSRCAFVLCVAVLGSGAGRAHAQRALLESTTRDGLAGPVAVVGDTAFLGVPGRARGAPGEVLVFSRAGSTWTLSQRLDAPAGAASLGNFGTSLAVEGDTLVVGAPALRVGGIERGEAYVFTGSGASWELVPDAAARPGDHVRYGDAVAIDAHWIVVGAPSNDSFAVPGAVAIFDRTGTDSPTVLEAGTDRTGLGTAVAVAAETVLASEPGTGAVIVYERGATWAQTHSLSQPGGAGIASRFGASLAVAGVSGSDLRVLVGAPQTSTSDGAVGAVFAFDRSAGVWPAIGGAMVEVAGLAQSDAFGQAVALDPGGALAVVGAPLADVQGMADAGRAHVLGRMGETWGPIGTLEVGAPTAGEALGSFVALADDTILAGAPAALEGVGYGAVFDVPAPLGAACTTAFTCGSGHCVDDVCCASDCAAECMRCDTAGACVADLGATTCSSACGVSGTTGMCRAGLCAAAEGDCPDAGVGPMLDGGAGADAGPRRHVSGCRCRVGAAASGSNRSALALTLALGVAVLERRRARARIRTSRGS